VGRLFGREAELTKGRAILESAARGSIVRALRIVGPSGYGKTALAETIGAEAAAGGWVVAFSPNFRIHASLPLFAARRAAQALIEALGQDAERYRSGLTLDRERPEDFEESFYRLVEGVTLDHRLLFVLDDAQWADAESRLLLERAATALADRAIVLFSTERVNESDAPAFGLSDDAIVLDELAPGAAIAIVREIYPDANDEVAAAIAEDTRGRAIDVVAVSTAARDNRTTTPVEVSANVRRLVARDIALLDANLRMFLQTCALIEDPIELRLLEQMWPQNELFGIVDRVVGRYLVGDGRALQFVHATVRDSVLETIPIEIPLRHRIIDALKRLPSPGLEDYERLAAQGEACGDRVTEREALIALSKEGAAKSAFPLAASAMERALAIASPETDAIISTYAQLSQMYNAQGRTSDAIRVSRRALAEAERAGIREGLGAIVSSLVLAEWHSGAQKDALATLARYERELAGIKDRADLATVGEFVAMHRHDFAAAARYKGDYEVLAADAPPLAVIRHHVANAYLAMRSGDEDRASLEIRKAEERASGAHAIYGVMPLVAAMMHVFHFRGMSASEPFLQAARERRLSMGLVLTLHCMIGRGELRDIEDILSGRPFEATAEQQLRGARYAAAAFRRVDWIDPLWRTAEQHLRAFEAGNRHSNLLPITSSALVPLSKQSPARARRLLDEILAAASTPLDAQAFLYPILIVVTAKELDARDAIEQVASGRLWCDKQPWNQAHHLLARGFALNALARDGAAELREAADLFNSLGATYFAAYASEASQKREDEARAGRSRPNNITRRESEVAALVADGLTNREIAEKLVLSERTVESHVASLFNKCNVGSRTALATWFLRNISPVA
jgi:DNA-binding CsgD family transcriptional regulator